MTRPVPLLVSIAAFVTMAGLGVAQLLKDGSFWIDEASVALSLLHLEPLETFGPLVGGQSFPRLYLFVIRGLVEVFGYQTLVARALPHLFFLLATAAWVRLLYLRFRDAPLWIVLGTLLLVVPAPWFVYGAILKAYSLDVLLAAVPFLLRDDFYDRTLARGESTGRLLALTAVGSLSYPFAMVLLARGGGWWLARGVRGDASVSARGLAAGLGGVAFFAALVWASDLRHTEALGDALRDFWSACLIGADGTATGTLLDRFVFGWWDGRSDFSHGGGLAAGALWAVRLGFSLGLLRVAASLVPRFAALRNDDWGSRSLGCAVLLAGLPLASWIFGYPICAGRLTLFALLPIVLVALEGFALAGDVPPRLRGGQWLGVGIAALLIVWIAPTSYRDAATRAAAAAPHDLRPLLAKVREAPDVPILTNSCTKKQIETLPERAPGEVFYVEQGGGIAVATREPPEAWLLFIPESFCRKGVERVRKSALTSTPHHEPGDEARLLRLRFPDLPSR